LINFFLIKHQLEKQNTEIEQLNTQKFQLDDQVEDLKSRICSMSDKLENKNIDVHEDEVDNCYL
jgi:predicted site-specific integrase-resolvase